MLFEMLLQAVSDRSSGVLTVTCPNCEHKNEFPELLTVAIFVCTGCGEPIEVVEPRH
jgi:uncharacterized protein (DUF983 family)